MVNLTINNKKIQVPEGTTILAAAAQAGIKIPTLCYLKEINEIGACRVCVVEVEGKETLVASCNTAVEEGMVVYTNSYKAQHARRMNVQLILSEHDAHCASCLRSGNCTLQSVANDLNIGDVPLVKNMSRMNGRRIFRLFAMQANVSSACAVYKSVTRYRN